jgi:hypothetical protein
MWWMGLIAAGVGIAQTAIAASQETPSMQKYSMTPENRLAGRMLLQTAKRGMSGAQENKFKQDLASQGTATRQMFQNAGFSGLGNAATNIMGIDALNQFAAENANVMRQGRSDYANWAQNGQGLANKNVEESNAYAARIAAGQGETLKAGIGNIIGGVNAASNAALANKSIDTYGKIAANANNDMSQTLTPTRIGGYGGGNYPTQFQNQTPAPAYQPSQVFSQNFPNALGQVPSAMNGVPNPYAQFMFPGGQPAYQSSFGSQGFGAASMPEEGW